MEKMRLRGEKMRRRGERRGGEGRGGAAGRSSALGDEASLTRW